MSDFLFDYDPEKAAYWPTKESAAFDCDGLNVMNVEFTAGHRADAETPRSISSHSRESRNRADLCYYEEDADAAQLE